MTNRNEILSDLRKQFGSGKYLLTPKELAPIINRSPAVQANMRVAGNFPLPIIKTGKKIGVSVYDLADYLAGGSVASAPEATTKPTTKIQPATKRRGSRDWLLAFEQSVMYQHEILYELREIRLKEIAQTRDAE